MNMTPIEAKTFMDSFNKLVNSNSNKILEEVVYGLGVPSVDLTIVSETKNMLVAAQNIHFEKNGAFTGELNVEMIKAVGANSVILGHSERRAMFNETDQAVNRKVLVALANNLTPIVCVGETLEQYENNKSKEVVKESILKSLAGITD
jgi:triosephosphate isomerase